MQVYYKTGHFFFFLLPWAFFYLPWVSIFHWADQVVSAVCFVLGNFFFFFFALCVCCAYFSLG